MRDCTQQADNPIQPAVQQSRYFTVFFNTPIPSISISIISQLLRYTFGFRAVPTPAGVPVIITVPGNRVMFFEQ